MDCHYTKKEEIFTSGTELIEIPISQMLRVAAELRIPFARSDLKVKILNPLCDPTHLTVACEEATSKAKATKGLVQVTQGFFRNKGHGVAI